MAMGHLWHFPRLGKPQNLFWPMYQYKKKNIYLIQKLYKERFGTLQSDLLLEIQIVSRGIFWESWFHICSVTTAVTWRTCSLNSFLSRSSRASSFPLLRVKKEESRLEFALPYIYVEKVAHRRWCTGMNAACHWRQIYKNTTRVMQCDCMTSWFTCAHVTCECLDSHVTCSHRHAHIDLWIKTFT